MIKILLLISVFFIFLAGCASSGGPVLYPNAHLKAVGKEQAEIDVGECERLANEYIKTNPGGDVAGSTAAGGAGGAVVGGAVGAVTGNIGKGAGIGGAAGAAGGFVRGISKSSKPSQVYKNFVSRCLREKGYEPIGWQ
ncbi:MAG: cell envelope biogenesis protein OmpA [Nitrospiraceae bacterium]|nr:MAG: cell envelope biogenesis protein OmpA [Nitrospiraceae bacterium]